MVIFPSAGLIERGLVTLLQSDTVLNQGSVSFLALSTSGSTSGSSQILWHRLSALSPASLLYSPAAFPLASLDLQFLHQHHSETAESTAENFPGFLLRFVTSQDIQLQKEVIPRGIQFQIPFPLFPTHWNVTSSCFQHCLARSVRLTSLLCDFCPPAVVPCLGKAQIIGLLACS